MAAQGGCVGSELSAHPALQSRRLNRPTHNLLPPYENPPVYHGMSELLLPAHLPGFVWITTPTILPPRHHADARSSEFRMTER